MMSRGRGKRSKAEELAIKESVRCNIVSLRINDEEREMLDQISRRRLMTVSDIMREAMLIAAERWSGVKSKTDSAIRDCGMGNAAHMH